MLGGVFAGNSRESAKCRLKQPLTSGQMTLCEPAQDPRFCLGDPILRGLPLPSTGKLAPKALATYKLLLQLRPRGVRKFKMELMR
eukprot:s2899_g5.t1